ncbi:MAG TPA: hypothetical protein VGK20_16130 [Candidatus Binatia bacterium]
MNPNNLRVTATSVLFLVTIAPPAPANAATSGNGVIESTKSATTCR